MGLLRACFSSKLTDALPGAETRLPRHDERKKERLDAKDGEGGRSGVGQAVRCQSLSVRNDARWTGVGAEGTRASMLMTEVQWGFPAN
jgi:hypothetical protein